MCPLSSVCWISACEGSPVCDPHTPTGCEGRKHGARNAAVQTQAGTWWTWTGNYRSPRTLVSPLRWGLGADLISPLCQLRALGTVPMCSTQMERMFNTTRIPGIETGRQAWAAKRGNESPYFLGLKSKPLVKGLWWNQLLNVNYYPLSRAGLNLF